MSEISLGRNVYQKRNGKWRLIADGEEWPIALAVATALDEIERLRAVVDARGPTVRLTDEVDQDLAKPLDAPGYLVLAHHESTWSDAVYADYHDAKTAADDMAEEHGLESWPVYPLWAGEAVGTDADKANA